MLYVFDTEGDNEILGPYSGFEEDAIFYMSGYERKQAPEDSVVVREVTRAEIVAEFERFQRRIENAKMHVVAGGFGDTGLNSLVAIGVEMARYAEAMGAAFSMGAAGVEVDRLVREERHYIERRAHSRQFEEAAV